MSKFKTYLFSIVMSVLFVLSSPIFIITIFLSGDSATGKDTAGNMITVTAFILVFLLVISFVLNLIFRLIFKRDNPEYSTFKATLITLLPSAIIYILFAGYLVITA